MPEELHSFLAGANTPVLVKPVAYDTIEVPMIENSEIRKIAHDVHITLPTSERMVQRSSMGTWMFSWLGGGHGRLWRLCAEGGKRYTQALYFSEGFGDL